ncbi:MAG TPA: phage replisome organizer N-terminal domain-containing protein [Oligella sp.]|nr:phage replisome organizer N-terminal domain-containing protein [Oligella sp.]
MADVKWIKIVSDIFDDEKILLIEQMPESESLIVIWFKLLCLAGKQNNSGVFMINERITYTDEMLAAIFRRKVDVVRMAIKVYEQFGMIEIIDGVITIPNWGKYQNFDKIDLKNEYMRKYMQTYRQKQIKKTCKANSKTNSKTNGKVNVSSADIDLEEDLDIYKEKEIKEKVAVAPSRSQFVKPSLKDIQAYCNERGNYISAEAFFNHYESNGWRVGKTAMKDWQSAVRGWEVRHKQEHPELYEKPKNTAQQVQQWEQEKELCRQQRFKQDKQWAELDRQKRALTIAIVNGEDKQAEFDEAVKALEQRKKEVLGL